MASEHDAVNLAGSERPSLEELDASAKQTGSADPNERVVVTVVLRRRTPPSKDASIESLVARSASEREPLSREQFAAQYGASPDDIKKVETFAEQHGLTVVQSSAAGRTVELAGTVADMSTAFGVTLTRTETQQGTFRTRSGPIRIPAALRNVVRAVTGLDDRPQVTPHFRLRSERGGVILPHAIGHSFTPLQVASLYNFPTDVDGTGQCIAILEFGGGYRPADLTAYFNQLGIPAPNVSTVSVSGGQNRPTGNPNGPDGEVMLDIEVVGAVAPGARIVVYFAPNSSKGFVDAVTTAVHDTTNQPSIISISWGGPEMIAWTGQAMAAMDDAFQDAVALGINVFCASGDSGSGDGVRVGAHVDFPASSPNVVGCGGTQLDAASGKITGEVVWNDPGHGATGGGVSQIFSKPDWQNDSNVPAPHRRGHGGRGVPDVAGDASPISGYQVLIDGQQAVIGGTSAVAPLWAGLTALLNQKAGHSVGFLNPTIYGLAAGSGAFHDIVDGNNGAYKSAKGWDPCTGNGSPDGKNLAAAI